MYILERYLERYMNFEKTPQKDSLWLKTMQSLCTHCAQPQSAYKSIHVAGSKGKGSVSVLCASVLEEAGFKTGLYTSPHVSDIRERVGRASGFLSEAEYQKALDIFIPAVEHFGASKSEGKKNPTWFELMTLFSFMCFRSCGMDWGVFETGLGGRLDSTNVILPEVCAINLIELEHTEYLGNTLQAIAAEKAGIIKRGVPVCIARQKDSVKKVFADTARKMDAPVFFLDESIAHIDCRPLHTDLGRSDRFYTTGKSGAHGGAIQKVRIDFQSDGKREPSARFVRPLSFTLKLAGNFQAENAALAALTLKTALPDLDEAIIERGFAKAFLPARFEILQTAVFGKTLTLVSDGCHTPNSLSGTLDSFFQYFGKGAHLLFACAADKDVQALARIISESACAFSRITLTIPGTQKASNYAYTCTAFAAVFSADMLHGSEHYEKEIRTAAENAAKENKPLLAAGSFYLAAEVKRYLQNTAEF